MDEELPELTPTEKRAIASLKRAVRRWPRSLWLYSAAGTLCVMKKDADGHKIMLPGTGRAGGFDPDAQVDTIKVENEGGDW
jgi:hypothetical protein